VPEPERPPDHLSVIGWGLVVHQHFGDQPVRLDERPHQQLGHQRPHLRQQRVRPGWPSPQKLFPVRVVPVHLLAHLAPVLVAVPEVELELQQVAEPADLGPKGVNRLQTDRLGRGQHGQLAQRRVEQEVD